MRTKWKEGAWSLPAAAGSFERAHAHFSHGDWGSYQDLFPLDYWEGQRDNLYEHHLAQTLGYGLLLGLRGGRPGALLLSVG